MRRPWAALCATLTLASGTAPSAQAQSYPSRTVRIIVPATTGSADVFARALAQRLAKPLGQAMLACSINPTAAAAVGIDHRKVVLMAFVFAAGLGALGGVLIAPITTIAARNLTPNARALSRRKCPR